MHDRHGHVGQYRDLQQLHERRRGEPERSRAFAEEHSHDDSGEHADEDTLREAHRLVTPRPPCVPSPTGRSATWARERQKRFKNDLLSGRHASRMSCCRCSGDEMIAKNSSRYASAAWRCDSSRAPISFRTTPSIAARRSRKRANSCVQSSFRMADAAVEPLRHTPDMELGRRRCVRRVDDSREIEVVSDRSDGSRRRANMSDVMGGHSRPIGVSRS